MNCVKSAIFGGQCRRDPAGQSSLRSYAGGRVSIG